MRTITLVIETEETPPEWIYKSILDLKPINGVTVKRIAEGDVMKSQDEIESQDEEL